MFNVSADTAPGMEGFSYVTHDNVLAATGWCFPGCEQCKTLSVGRGRGTQPRIRCSNCGKALESTLYRLKSIAQGKPNRCKSGACMGGSRKFNRRGKRNGSKWPD